jgi:aminoglycoside 3-N-acetyltransferase I
MESIRYRKLDKNDIDAVRALLGVYVDVFKDQPMPDDMAFLEKRLRDDHIWFFVASKDDEVIGGLTAYVLPSIYGDRGEVYIYDMAIAEAYQRLGVGSGLLDHFKEYCASAGIKEFYLQADTEDIHAREFYKKNGGIEEDVRHYDFRV